VIGLNRDIKPENILMDSEGHIRLSDYVLARDYIKKQQEFTTICGSPNYLPPEMLLNKPYNFSIDWWQFGVLTYECLAGSPPFYHEEYPVTFENILKVTPTTSATTD